MPRAPRIQYEGAIYHVMARGDRREPIVFDDSDREMFVATLSQVVAKTGWELLAWVLMDNHYHLCFRTPKANLVEGMRWFQNTFTRRINVRHELWGHLFGGRYKSVLVESDFHGPSEGQGDYLTTLIDYIHLNPARSGLVDGDESRLSDYPWSSIAYGYALSPTKRQLGLAVKEGLELFSCADSATGRRKYLGRLDARIRSEEGLDAEALHDGFEGQSLNQTLERGWCWGSEAFRESLLPHLEEARKDRKEPPPSLRSLKRQEQARMRLDFEQILADAQKHFGLSHTDLQTPVWGNCTRTAIAWVLNARTSQTQASIAKTLGFTSGVNLSQQIRRFRERDEDSLPDGVGEWVRRYGV